MGLLANKNKSVEKETDIKKQLANWFDTDNKKQDKIDKARYNNDIKESFDNSIVKKAHKKYGFNFNTYNEEYLHDDLEILGHEILYNEERQATHFLYHIKVKEDHEEEWKEEWKAVKICRLIESPRRFRQETALMDIWEGVLVGLYDKNVNFINIIANILEPKFIGTLFCYGVQGIADTREQAIHDSNLAYAGLIRILKGNFSQMKLRLLKREEADWIDVQLGSMRHLLMLRGIPKANDTSGQGVSSGISGDTTPETEEQNEEFIRGMSDTEYIMMTITSPVVYEDLYNWLEITSWDLTKIKSEMQGSKGIGVGLSLPIMFAGNIGSAFGKNTGESNSFGHASATSVTQSSGFSVSESSSTGTSYSHAEGTSFTSSVSKGLSQSLGFSQSQGMSFAQGVSQTIGQSHTTGTSFSQGISNSVGNSFSHSIGDTISTGTSIGHSTSDSTGSSTGASFGRSDSTSNGNSFSVGQSNSIGQSHSTGTSANTGISHSMGSSVSDGTSASHSTSQNTGYGYSDGTNVSQGQSHTVGTSASQGTSSSFGTSSSVGTSNTTGQSHNLGTSDGTSISQNHGSSESFGVNQSSSNGTNVSNTWSQGTSQSVGSSESFGGSASTSSSHSSSDGVSAGTSFSNGYSEGQSMGTSFGSSYGQSASLSNSQSQSASSSYGYSAGRGDQTQYGVNFSAQVGSSALGLSGTVSFPVHNELSIVSKVLNSVGISMTNAELDNHTVSASWGENAGVSASASNSVSQSQGQSWGLSQSASSSLNQGHSWSTSSNSGTSHSVSDGSSVSNGNSWSGGTSQSNGTSSSLGASSGTSRSDSIGSSYGTGTSVSYGEGTSHGTSEGYGTSVSTGLSTSQGQSSSNGVSTSNGVSDSVGASNSYGTSHSNSFSQSQGFGDSSGTSHSSGTSESMGTSSSVGSSTSDGTSSSQGTSTSQGTSQSTSQGTSSSLSNSTSASHGTGYSEGTSNSASRSTSDSYGQTYSYGQSESQGTSVSDGTSLSTGKSATNSVSSSVGKTTSTTNSMTESQGTGKSVTDSVGTTESTGKGQSISSTNSQGSSLSDTTALAMTTGLSNSVSRGSSSSMGFGPSISWNKSAQWSDEGRANLALILDAQRNRLMEAIRQGAFYVDIFIFTPDEEAKQSASNLAKSAWKDNVFPAPLEVVEPDMVWSQHLMLHASVFSQCNAAEDELEVMEGYKWSTILTPSELCAYNHPPRVEGGGIKTTFESIPYFALPTSMEGESFLGHCISTETGETTKSEYRFTKGNMMHTLIAGSSGTGKTVSSTRYVAECINEMGCGATILDWKDDWRKLLFLIKDPKRFRFYSCGSTPVSKLEYNVLAIPYGVTVDLWIDAVVEGFVLGFGLGQRGYEIIWRGLARLYGKRGVFEDTENSKDITLVDLFNEINLEIENKQSEKKAGFGDVEAYNRVLARLGYFKEEYSMLYKMFGQPKNPVPLTELCKKGCVTVIEAGGLKGPVKSFILGVIATGIFLYGRAMQEISPEDSFIDTKHMIVFEEAHEIVKGMDSGGSGDASSGVTEASTYEIMWNEGRSAGFILVAIAQMPIKLPGSVLGNTATYMIHRLGTSDDIDEMSRRIGRDPKIENKDVPRFMERMPLGHCIVQVRNVKNHADAEPVYVEVSMMDAMKPTPQQLANHMKKYFNYVSNDEERLKQLK